MGDKELKEKAEKAAEKVEKKVEKTKEKVEETKDKVEAKAEKVKDDVKSDVEYAKKEAKDLKDNVEEKFVEAKGYVKKNNKRVMILTIIVVSVLLIACIMIAVSKSPKGKINKMFDTFKNDPYEFSMKYEPNRKYRKQRHEVLNSRTKFKIKKIEKVNKDKYKVDYTVKSVSQGEVSRNAYKKAREDKEYKANTNDSEDIRKNQKILLEKLEEEVKKADINSEDKSLTFLKDTDGNWTVEEFELMGKGFIND